MIKLIIISSVLLFLTSCLRTRSDIGYDRPGYNTPKQDVNKGYDPNSGYANSPQENPSTAQRQYQAPSQPASASSFPITNKPIGTQFNQKDLAMLQINLQEINDQIRSLNGRLEVVEKKVYDSQAQAGAINIDSKLKNYELALSSLEAQVQSLKSGRVSTLGSSDSSVKLSAFARGENAFKQKNWQKAISEYQLYREQQPRGNDYSEATYKIGVCFQELNMKSEAGVFYQEVVSKYPKSKAGKKAKYRLKQL